MFIYNYEIAIHRKEYVLSKLYQAIDSGVPVEDIQQDLDWYYQNRTKQNDSFAMLRLGGKFERRTKVQKHGPWVD